MSDTPTTPTTSPTLEGSIVPATVVRVDANAAVVSFGWKAEAGVPLDEFPKANGKPSVKVGDKFEVWVEWLADDAKDVILSKDKAQKLRRFEELVGICEQGGPVEGTVLSRDGKGYHVDIGLPAFLPSNQASARRLERPDSIVGQTFNFEITEFKPEKMRITLSRKALSKQEDEAKRAATLERVKEGAVLTGTVKSVADYGAFVDLGGGVDGLLHVSQMSWTHINHPREVVKVGQELQVQVLKVDADAGKIGLGLRQLQENPWAHVAERFPAGATVEGTVSGFAEFGAFVELAPGVQGMIHVSEMSWAQKVKHPSDVLKEGEKVKAQVLQVDQEHHRLSLSMKALQANPWTVLAEKYPEGSTVHGTIRRITEFGLFVGLEDGIDGLVHVSELTWNGKVNHPNELYKEGQEVDALVVKVDTEDQRIGLSIKQLQPSPWKTFAAEHPVGSKLKARVTRVVDFGAFLEAAPGIEGLIHVSELSEEHVDRVANVVRVGQELEVQVIELDVGRRKVGFSVKAMTAISPEEYRKHMQQNDVKTTLGDVFRDKLTKKE
ncbi:MAG: 30S ribosomal protein S1 [Deltaproteobacteria bacterium]|nr:30S ribosomal protein S1 [Deltaproteobacteria bacterium]